MSDAEIKAELIAVGTVNIDRSLLGDITIPTAGPGAGKTAFFFRWNAHRVRLAVDEGAKLKAVADNGDVVIFKGPKVLVRGHIEEELIHCPEQAYITISEQCIFDCKYCPVPKLSGKIKSLDEIVRMVEEAYSKGNLKAISITSGVAGSAEEEVERAVEAVKALRKYSLPIGVSVYPTADSNLKLKEAGVVEIKYNVETMDREIFKRVCPGMDHDFIIVKLKEAVGLFGRNFVFSNFIIGLGESDETVEAGLEELASILDQAKEGDRIFMTAFGSGAGSDAFSITVTDKIEDIQSGAPKVQELLADPIYLNYASYAKHKGKIRV